MCVRSFRRPVDRSISTATFEAPGGPALAHAPTNRSKDESRLRSGRQAPPPRLCACIRTAAEAVRRYFRAPFFLIIRRGCRFLLLRAASEAAEEVAGHAPRQPPLRP